MKNLISSQRIFTLSKRIVQIFITLVLLACLSACGGGASNDGGESFDSFSYDGGTTGSGRIDVFGTLSGDEGSELSNVTVTLEETGQTAVTDENGNFSINVDEAVAKESLTFKFLGNKIAASSVVEAIPADTVSINVEFLFDENDGSVETGEVDIITENNGVVERPAADELWDNPPVEEVDSTPAPAPAPAPTPTPTPTPASNACSRA